MKELRDGTATADPRLDRLVQFDERNRNFPVTAAPEAARRIDKTWRLFRRYQGDQGQEGACVEYGITHSLLAQPRPVKVAVAKQIWSSHRIYHPAQERDPWPGGSYPGASPFYEGTSVLAGLQVAQGLGLFENYYWAFTYEQFIHGLLNVGSAILGLWWTEGMSRPAQGGLIEATGAKRGGHCVAAIGVDYGRKFLRGTFDVLVIAQSWGLSHGDKGRVYLPLNQFDELRQDDGECAFVTGRTGLKNLG